jgi:bifunctional UDP-N-acetylglucosamine pyrophosphorylase / glucosamine-1-phosphate N-acetyltransferase
MCPGRCRARTVAVQSIAPSVVIIAAGTDARMRSELAGPLHRLCGRPMIRHVVDAVLALEPRRFAAVVGPGCEDVAKELEGTPAEVGFVSTDPGSDPCGAVHSVLAAWNDDELGPADPDDDPVLVLPANVPLLRGETLRAMYLTHRRADVSATALVGGVVGEDTSVVWFVRRSLLAPALRRADTADIAGIGAVLRDAGHEIHAFVAPFPEETSEISDRVDLAASESCLRERVNSGWLRRGVTMRDARHTYIDVTVTLGSDVTLYPGVVLEGSTIVGEGTEVGPGCRLVDSRVGARCRLDRTSAELATIGDHCRVGPFAVLEPGSEIPAATVTGPFYTAGPDTV